MLQIDICYSGNYAWFNNIKYIKNNKLGYYSTIMGGKTRYLHRDVWEYYKGEIPCGSQIHHIISKDYNEIDGLICITEAEHKASHMLERMDNMEEKEYVCAECGKTFLSKRMYSVNKDRVFCSNACNKRYVHFNEPEVRICKHCKKEFFAHKYKPKDFCSRECMLESKAKTCVECNKVFIPNTAAQIYCSKRCGDNFRYKQEHPLEQKQCPHCGKAFVPATSKQVYCRNVCAQVERTKRYRAKKKILGLVD